ncbi:beta-ketoacyl synthase N-terminal-like domain-containing protein [Streptomyces sp. NPDC048639]|uniref:beta-ketoacyl synthase N-terminal-like domain-containing protein n=1 Tax=Streptomyces sp. NPDC048639 TaxID=3365581 RepID=UPI003710B4B6
MTSYIDYLDSLSKKQLMVMLARRRQEETQGIALVGMGCRLPGGIDDPRALWTALREGHVLPTEDPGVPTDSLGRPRWNLDAPDLAPLAGRLRQGAYLKDIDLFDAEFFGIPDQEAVHMDPQQRLLLEAAVQALADANLSRARLAERSVGVFAGAGPVEYPYAWLRGGLPEGALSGHMSTGSSPSAFSGRIALALRVNGPVITVDTASSSMLTAVHLAVQALRRRECDIALVGACNVLMSPFSTGILDRAGMLSPTGRSRPFTRHADGHVRGEGCGVVVLKRYADAVADGDEPYAVVRGSAVHQQGDRPGMSVASARGQKAVVELALRDAGVEPDGVQYVEAQANGSKLGGVIEAESVAESYARHSPAAAPLHVGSCKANLGYLETASGAPGLMKTALALAHAELPPQPGENDLDPDIPWQRMALRFAAKATPWPSDGGPRRAGISGFGFGGTNAHVVLEAAPERPTAEPDSPGPWLLVVSGHNGTALTRTAARLRRHLHDTPGWSPSEVCRTLAEGRDPMAVRYAAVVHHRDAVLDALARAAEGERAPLAGAGDRSGVFLDLPEPDGEELRLALEATGRPGFEALDRMVRDHTAALGADGGPPAGGDQGNGGTASVDTDGRSYLAWALGWIGLLETSGLEVAGARLTGPGRHALAAVVTRGATADDISSGRWSAGSAAAPPLPGTWQQTESDGALTLRRRESSGSVPTLTPARTDLAGWLALLAERFGAGAALALPELWPSPGPRLLRLPGPALTGRRYWPEHNNWR